MTTAKKIEWFERLIDRGSALSVILGLILAGATLALGA
jgi:hypothetical protein